MVSTNQRATNSASSTNTSSGSNRLCAQCRNHGLKVPVRGHKRYCAHRSCTCKECMLVKERQRVVALHLYVRRAQEQEEEAAAAAANSSNSSILGRTPSRTIVENNESPSSSLHNPSPPPPPTIIPSINPVLLPSPEVIDAEEARDRMLLESLMELRRIYPVPDSALHLLLCVIKSSRSVNEAYAKIFQAAQELTASGIIIGPHTLHYP